MTLAPTTQLRSTRNPTRTKQLAQIHQAAHRAGYVTRLGVSGRELYENELMICCGLRSSRQASRTARLAIIAHFEALELDRRTTYAALDADEQARLEQECLELLNF